MRTKPGSSFSWASFSRPENSFPDQARRRSWVSSCLATLHFPETYPKTACQRYSPDDDLGLLTYISKVRHDATRRHRNYLRFLCDNEQLSCTFICGFFSLHCIGLVWPLFLRTACTHKYYTALAYPVPRISGRIGHEQVTLSSPRLLV